MYVSLQKDLQDHVEWRAKWDRRRGVYELCERERFRASMAARLATPTSWSAHPKTWEENCRAPGTQREDRACSACPSDDLHLNCMHKTKQNNFFLNPFIWKPWTLVAAPGCWFHMRGPGLCTAIRFLFYLSAQEPKALLQGPHVLKIQPEKRF